MEQQYYIVSLKHTSKADSALTMWCANSRGYTWDKSRAGIYTESQLSGIVNEDNVAVPKQKADEYWTDANDFGDRYTAIPNTTKILKNLGLSTKFMKPSKQASCRMIFIDDTGAFKTKSK